MNAAVVVSWLGAAGVLAYVVHIHLRRSRSFLEGRVLLLLYVLATLFSVRGFFWLFPGEVLRILTLLPATLLPLAATLFVEALLRRHAPLWLKGWVAVGTPVFLVAAPLSSGVGAEGVFFRTLSVYVVATLVALAGLLVGRRRGDLSPAENALADGVAIASALAVLVAMTDFRLRPDWLDLRLGGLGGLFLVYACVRLGRLTAGAGAGRRLVLEAVSLLLKTVALTAGLVAVVGTPRREWLALAAVSLGFVLLFTVLDLLRAAGAGEFRSYLRRWLIHADVSSPATFQAALERLPWAGRHLLVGEAELDGYDVDVLTRAFDGDSPIRTLSELRAAGASPGGPEERATREQLVDLLESFDMRQVALLRRNPLLLLLVRLPDVATAEEHGADLALISKVARLGLRGTVGGAR